ncbi:MAG: EAL domain-containing protein, partial [Erysipelotrichaceae bacterium]|nr:EAL domain-containing protein [Erysipelotrichaceae bacterium]
MKSENYHLNRIEFDHLKSYIEILFENKESIKAISDAFSLVADDLHIGRIEGDIIGTESESEIAALAENKVPYTSDKGFDPSKEYIFEFKTITGKEGKMHVYPIPNYEFTPEDEECIKMVLEISDIHLNRVVAYQEIQESLLIQNLSKLPNAAGYMKKIAKKCAMGTIGNYDSYYFNLSGFGLVNKRFGGMEGNRIIIRYSNKLREYVTDDEVLGHLGGDNFVALIKKGENSKKFQQMLNDGIVVDATHPSGENVKLKIESNAGFMHVLDNASKDSIMAGPAIALAHAKATKKKLVELTDEISEAAVRSKSIEHSFERALANNEFVVYYQPKVNSVTGEIIGCEALARWYENDRLINPMSFIPILERSGKIVMLDLFILETVCRNISDWKKMGKKAVPCSVNFSRRDLADKTLPKKIMEIVTRHGVDKSEIVIEVTETASEDESMQMIDFLGKLKEYGVETSIDDFGTGYSSLSALREYPVSEIKIDRSFINKKLGTSDEIIIRSII